MFLNTRNFFANRLLALKSDLKLKQLEEWGLSQKNKKPSHCTMCGHSG